MDIVLRPVKKYSWFSTFGRLKKYLKIFSISKLLLIHLQLFPWTTIFKLFGKIVSFIILSQIFLHNFVNSQRTYRKSGFNLCSYLIFFWITVKAKKFRILQKIACKWNFIRYKGFLRFMVQITLLILQYPSPSGLCFTKYKF